MGWRPFLRRSQRATGGQFGAKYDSNKPRSDKTAPSPYFTPRTGQNQDQDQDQAQLCRNIPGLLANLTTTCNGNNMKHSAG